MTAPVSQPIAVPNQQPYYAWWRVNDAGEWYAHGRGTDIVEPPPPTVGVRAQWSKLKGRAVYVPPPGGGSRDDLVIGVDRPTRATAGCPDRRLVADGGALVEVPNDITYSGSSDPNAPLQVVDKWFTGKVSFNTGYVDVKRCQGVGNPTIVGPVFQCTNVNVQRIRIYDTDIWHQNPQWDSPGVKGWHVELYRCYMRGCTDGIAHIGYGWVTNPDGTRSLTSTGNYTTVDQNIVMEQCLIELMCYRSPDPGASGKLPDNASHLDVGIQTRGGRNFRVRGNAIYAFVDPTIGEAGLASVDMISGTHLTGKRVTHTGLYTLSAFMFSPNLGEIFNWVADSNWLDGATELFVMAERLGGFSITNNFFGRLHRAQAGLVQCKIPEAVFPFTGNVYWYELGPGGEKWPYNQQPIAEAGETMPSAGKIAEWVAAGIDPNNKATWPSANIKDRG